MATMSELAAAKRFLNGLCDDGEPVSVLAAVSGGLDSMCLLHLLASWGRQRKLTIIAAHFNHRLRPTADRDEEFVRNWCAENGIPFVSDRGDVRAAAERDGLTIEEAARSLRYAFLAVQRKKLGCTFVLTAHHADDNAETMLLNLLRGTGLRGLTGIPEMREQIARPFLQVTREELESYAEQHAIPHVEDETNALDDASRNVLRHQVLPVLRQLNPRAVENMTRTAQLLAEDEKALERQADALLCCGNIEPGRRASLPVKCCEGQPKAVVGRVLLHMMVGVSGHQKDISAAHVEALEKLLRGESGQEISLPYEMTGRRNADVIEICRGGKLAEAELKENCPVIWGDYQLTLLNRAEGEGLAVRDGGRMCVAPCAPGERLYLLGANGSRSVKRLCIDHKISLAERDRLPAIYVDGRLAAVWQLGVDQEFLPENQENFRFIQIMKQIEEKKT